MKSMITELIWSFGRSVSQTSVSQTWVSLSAERLSVKYRSGVAQWKKSTKVKEPCFSTSFSKCLLYTKKLNGKYTTHAE